jgi:hypothetical protein
LGCKKVKLFDLFETRYPPITTDQLQFAARRINKLWHLIRGLEVEFTGHMQDRINNNPPRTDKDTGLEDASDLGIDYPVDIDELYRLFNRQARLHSREIKQWIDKTGVVDSQKTLNGLFVDTHSDINLPFVIAWDSNTNTLKLFVKSVMRKRGFQANAGQRQFTVENPTHNWDTY